MSKPTIAMLPGDGVGAEVLAAARIVLDRLELDAEYRYGDVGWRFWCEEGDALPPRTLEVIEESQCALFGAITSRPQLEAEQDLDARLRGKGLTYTSPIIRLRQHLDLHTNLRPCKSFPGNPCSHGEDVDLVVFRENTEGMYAGVEFGPVPPAVWKTLGDHNEKARRFSTIPPEDAAISLRIMTRQACRTIVSSAFDFARAHGRRHVTVVDKPNVLRCTGGILIEEARKAARDYPGIPLREANIDYQCMALVASPRDHDVLVAENLFGDILSDLSAQLVGGAGFAPSANLGDTYALFEPVHGSAPDIAGKNIANPVAMLLSVRMMLDWLGENARAARLEAAVAEVIRAGSPWTPDMGGTASTLEMAGAVADRC